MGNLDGSNVSVMTSERSSLIPIISTSHDHPASVVSGEWSPFPQFTVQLRNPDPPNHIVSQLQPARFPLLGERVRQKLFNDHIDAVSVMSAEDHRQRLVGVLRGQLFCEGRDDRLDRFVVREICLGFAVGQRE